MRTYSHVQDRMASHLSFYISEVCSQVHPLQPLLCISAGELRSTRLPDVMMESERLSNMMLANIMTPPL